MDTGWKAEGWNVTHAELLGLGLVPGRDHWIRSRVQFSVTLWTVAHQAPPSRGFSRQEYWSGLPFPPPGKSMEAASLMKQSSGAETVKYAFFPPFL